ncbi:MAG: hypothetical protein UIL73_07880 [Anaerovoracaceae bacterium]|nr:hypothetical protein [Anaerovoracaceae bacterium]
MGDIEREGKSKAVTDGSSFFFLFKCCYCKIGVNRTSSFLPAGKNRRNKDGGDVNVYEIFSDFSVNNSKKQCVQSQYMVYLKKASMG